MASVLLGGLDVPVDQSQCLEPLVTTGYIKHYTSLSSFVQSRTNTHTSRRGRGMDARPCGPSRAASACLGGHKKIRSLDECRHSEAA